MFFVLFCLGIPRALIRWPSAMVHVSSIPYPSFFLASEKAAAAVASVALPAFIDDVTTAAAAATATHWYLFERPALNTTLPGILADFDHVSILIRLGGPRPAPHSHHSDPRSIEVPRHRWSAEYATAVLLGRPWHRGASSLPRRCLGML